MKKHTKEWFFYNDRLRKVIERFFHGNDKYYIKEGGVWYTYSWKKTRTILKELRFKILEEL